MLSNQSAAKQSQNISRLFNAECERATNEPPVRRDMNGVLLKLRLNSLTTSRKAIAFTLAALKQSSILRSTPRNFPSLNEKIVIQYTLTNLERGKRAMKSFGNTYFRTLYLVIVRTLYLVIAIAICLFQPKLNAQTAVLVDSQSEVRDFHDKQGDVFVTGSLHEVSGSDVTIFEEGVGTTHIFNINKFSDEDRVWIRDSVSSHKKWLKKKEAADKVIVDLNSVQSVKVIKACKKLMTFGTAANHASPKLAGLLKSSDEKVVAAAFNSLSGVSKVDNTALQQLFSKLNSPSSQALRVTKKRPEKFIQTLPRFGKLAIPYLRAIAYHAKLDIKPVKASANPEALSVIGGDKSKIRIAACRALSEIELDSSAEILTSVIEVSDTGPANKRDVKTIQAGLKAIGRLGVDTPEVRAVLEKYKSEFAETVDKSMKGLK